MRGWILFFVLFLVSCNSRSTEITADQANAYPSSGEITFASAENAITKITLSYFSYGKRSIDVNKQGVNLSNFNINLPKIPGYQLSGVYITLSPGIIFLGTNYSDCINIKGKPVLLKSYGDGYSIPVIMLPNIHDPELCIDNSQMSGGHTY